MEMTFGESIVKTIEESVKELFGEMTKREHTILFYGVNAGMRVEKIIETAGLTVKQ